MEDQEIKRLSRKSNYDSVRIPTTLVREAVSLIPQVSGHPALRVTGHVSKALAVKVVLSLGLDAIKRGAGGGEREIKEGR